MYRDNYVLSKPENSSRIKCYNIDNINNFSQLKALFGFELNRLKILFSLLDSLLEVYPLSLTIRLPKK